MRIPKEQVDLQDIIGAAKILMKKELTKGLIRKVEGLKGQKGAGHWEMDGEYCISCGETHPEPEHHFSYSVGYNEALDDIKRLLEEEKR